MSQTTDSHLYAVKTTGGQEKVVMRYLEAKVNANQLNVQSVLWISDLKGYVIIEAVNPNDAFLAIQRPLDNTSGLGGGKLRGVREMVSGEF